MKKFALLFVMATLIFGSVYAGPVISINLHIGKKNPENTCPGFGFCKVSASLKEAGMVSGTLQVDDAKRMLVIGINESDILLNQPDKIDYFKGKKNVVFEEDFTISDDIRVKSEAKNTLIIRKGAYSIDYSKGVYYISTPL